MVIVTCEIAVNKGLFQWVTKYHVNFLIFKILRILIWRQIVNLSF